MSTPRRLALDDAPGLVRVAKVRPCLRCQRDFRSTWAGNRICRRCSGGRDDPLAGLPESWGATATEGVAD